MLRTIKKEYMHFGTCFDYQGEFIDIVHFPQSLKKYPFHGNGVYLIYGKIVQELIHFFNKLKFFFYFCIFLNCFFNKNLKHIK